jgi:ribonuclease P protein component
VIAGREVGGAVERNRAKRRLREAAARVPFRHGRDYVLVATRAVGKARFESLIDWVRAAVEVEDEK